MKPLNPVHSLPMDPSTELIGRVKTHMDFDPVPKADPSVRPTILLVDDAPANIQILIQILRDRHKLLIANGGAVALEIAAEKRPDLILLDVMMPEMDGHEVCRRLKADPATRSIPVIFVTGKNAEEDELVGLELGAVDYISKPFSLPIVRARVKTHLELKHYRDLLERQSVEDALTNIPNRRRYEEFLNFAWQLAARQKSVLSVVLMDVDHFKLYNDHYGHQAGDECLRKVAHALDQAIPRHTDLVARYGGEEFVAVLPGTDREGALHVAERLRSAVEALGLPHEYSSATDHVTLSLGVASSLPRAEEPSSRLIEAADQALYRAKQLGRNRVEA